MPSFIIVYHTVQALRQRTKLNTPFRWNSIGGWSGVVGCWSGWSARLAKIEIDTDGLALVESSQAAFSKYRGSNSQFIIVDPS
jgi:hypothetical protein